MQAKTNAYHQAQQFADYAARQAMKRRMGHCSQESTIRRIRFMNNVMFAAIV